MFKKLSKKKGFTLMEMMIVVAIIAIMMAIIIPTFSNAMNKAKIATDEANLRAYYAEQMANSILDGTAIPTSDNITSIKVAGVTYELQGGTAKSEVTGEGQLVITYTPDKGNAVTIPGKG